MMAFRPRELSVLAYANGFSLWHYRTADPLDDILAVDGGIAYFDAARDQLREGDQIIVTLSGKTPFSNVTLTVQISGEIGVVVGDDRE
ncbi:MAG: hypothetical protein Q7S17_06515 [Xanthobacteraceae bacterium]|nr:hypothetical protein [Xanthobacteraceae bacterium]